MLFGKSVTELRSLIEEKKITPSEVSEYFLKRIEKFNSRLNAFLTLNKKIPEKTGGRLGGIPLGVKDNFCTYGPEQPRPPKFWTVSSLRMNQRSLHVC